ncbi:MAG: hypothetical protein JXA75_06275, partial [Candidatus Thermoplasmatota archaeon]|nr:hypothetical protein [Candidatus Thermoplasmatota archaeon]
MAVLKKEKKEQSTSLVTSRIIRDVPRRKKKKLCIGFGQKQDQASRQKRSENIQGITSHKQGMHLQNTRSSEEKSIQIHEDIDLFLETVENQRFHEVISGFENLHSQEWVKKPDQRNWIGRTLEIPKDNEEVIRNEIEIRNRLLDDLERQILERQSQVVKKTETIMRLQKELERKDQVLRVTKQEAAETTELSRILQQEIKERDTIIQDIKGQLIEKQTWIVENNHFTEQLSRELEQSNRIIKKTKDEVTRKTVDFQKALKQAEERVAEIEELQREILSRNQIIETIENQLEHQQISVIERTEAALCLQHQIQEKDTQLSRLQGDLQQKQEELEWLQRERESRNRIIETITKQLTEKQTSLIERSMAAEQLQDDLLQSK